MQIPLLFLGAGAVLLGIMPNGLIAFAQHIAEILL
jgi:hypothetical protein